MKTIPIALQSHYESGGTTLARLWRIERSDGRIFGFTDHDASIDYAGLTYRTTSAFDASAIKASADLSVDNLEVLGVLDEEGIEAEEIEAGLWDGATIEIRQVNWANLENGAEVQRIGQIGSIQRKRGQYVAELRGLTQSLQNVICDAVQPKCNAELGDARCGIDLDGSPSWRFAGIVLNPADRRSFTTLGLSNASGFFDHGDLRFTSGFNDGVAMEVKRHVHDESPASTTIDLQIQVPYTITPGDTFIVTAGCDHTAATCKARFGNLVNFRGFPSVPGQDQLLLVGGQ